MTIDDISHAVATLESTDVTECVIEHGGHTLRIVFERTGRGSVHQHENDMEVETTSGEPDAVVVRTPGTGIFRNTHPLIGSALFDESGVRRGQHIGYLEIDSVLCPVVATADGMLNTLLLVDGSLTGYGQPVAEISVSRSEQRSDGHA